MNTSIRNAVAAPVCIIGAGYTGGRLAARWLARGAVVHTVSRRLPAAPGQAGAHGNWQHGDLDAPATLPLATLAGSRLYWLAPPPGSGERDTRIRALLDRLDTPPSRIVLISTTGVYGDCGGAWIDESRPPAPGSDRARRRLDAEQAAGDYARSHALPLVILRVAGIYGPGRLPLKRLAEGRPLPAAGDCGYTNRVHVDDLVEACVQAMARAALPRVINISDGAPSTTREHLDRVADALGYARLPVVPRARMATTLSARMLEYLGESRRIDNRRMRAALGITLRYPDAALALAAMRDSARAP